MKANEIGHWLDRSIDSGEVAMVWLDLDDTLQDFRANSIEALVRLYESARLGRWFDACGEWCACYMRHNSELWALYGAGRITKDRLRCERFVRPLVEGGCDAGEARAMWQSLDTMYLDFLSQGRNMVPGAMALLDKLQRRGVRMGILSNGFKEVQHRKIATAGIGRYFDLVVLSDDIGIQKPDRQLFDHAMRLAGHDNPSSMLMIGDNPVADIDGATGAGWQAVYFNRDGQGQPRAGVPTVTDLRSLL
ncbi:MAG: YjjG family noncanonical pyrimidine nucleotidase [Pseudoflavonifractor sp.]|nr:YjjG family noncanonical pyrimidine nucleotidase [Pseudoflavonifractor sp.]